jgi:hypothetical protein
MVFQEYHVPCQWNRKLKIRCRVVQSGCGCPFTHGRSVSCRYKNAILLIIHRVNILRNIWVGRLSSCTLKITRPAFHWVECGKGWKLKHDGEYRLVETRVRSSYHVPCRSTERTIVLPTNEARMPVLTKSLPATHWNKLLSRISRAVAVKGKFI